MNTLLNGISYSFDFSCKPKDELKERLSEIKCEIAVIQSFIGEGSLEEISDDLHEKIEKAEKIRQMIKETDSCSNV